MTAHPARGDVLLRATNLVKDFKGNANLFGRSRTGIRAVDNVSVEIEEGETLAIVGESGSGKSTVARLLARLMRPTSGTVEFEGQDVTHLEDNALREFRRSVQVVFQDPFSSLNPRHTVERIVSAPLRYQGIRAPKGYTHVVKELMERVGLNPDHSLRHPAQFSGGQAQRIGIARALASSPKIVICDEAVSALDVSVQAQIIDLLKGIQAELGLSYVFIAHDLAVVREISHSIAVMSNGVLVEQGTRDDVFERPQEEYTRLLLKSVPKIRTDWTTDR